MKKRSRRQRRGREGIVWNGEGESRQKDVSYPGKSFADGTVVASSPTYDARTFHDSEHTRQADGVSRPLQHGGQVGVEQPGNERPRLGVCWLVSGQSVRHSHSRHTFACVRSAAREAATA